jgi:DNA invertase Pin-like site-specific DNA recombinase
MAAAKKPKRVALYLRVSTDGQTTDNQQQALADIATRAGWSIVDVYNDNGVSGAKGRDKRPELDRLLKDAARRRFDVVAAWSVDRLGRSLQDLVAFLNEIHAVGVDLYLHQQGVDTTTPAGRALFQMLGVFAEFERALILERVMAGLERARAQGKQLGRRRGFTPARNRVRREVRRLRATGESIREIAKHVGVAPGTVQAILKEQRS